MTAEIQAIFKRLHRLEKLLAAAADKSLCECGDEYVCGYCLRMGEIGEIRMELDL